MDQLEKSRFLGEENLFKLMLKFSIPCVLAHLLSSIYNVVDQLFIGNSDLSTLGNAATGVVFPNCFLKMTSIFLQSSGYPTRSIMASTVRDIVCFVPLVIVLPLFFGVEGILFAGPIADLVAGVLALLLTVPVLRSMRTK